MKKTKLTRSLLAACSIVALSAVMYGCVHGGSDDPPADDPPPAMDTDGDGVPDDEDAFPNDPDEDTDTDGDGTGDNADAFPNDADEDTDTDGDMVGDNADAFPNDASETMDSDGDMVGDNADAFPNDASETMDSDGDMVGDNADAFPNDASETMDSDGDGKGDNAEAIALEAAQMAADAAADDAEAAADAAEMAANGQMANQAADEASYALAQNAATRARTAATAARAASDAAAMDTDSDAAQAEQAKAEAAKSTAETEKGNAEMYAGMVANAQQAIDDEEQRKMDVMTARGMAMQSYLDADADATKAEAEADEAEATAPGTPGAMAARDAATAARNAANAAKAAHDAITDGMTKAQADAQAAMAATQAGNANSSYMTAKAENEDIQTASGISNEQNRVRDVAAATTAAGEAATAARTAATTARTHATNARTAANAAKASYERAKSARTDSEEANKQYMAADAAATAAENAAMAAEGFATAAETAHTGIDPAGSGAAAQAAQQTAEDRQGDAEMSRDTADTQMDTANTARDDAMEAADTHVVGLLMMANAVHITTAADPDANVDDTEVGLIEMNRLNHVAAVNTAVHVTTGGPLSVRDPALTPVDDQGGGTVTATWHYYGALGTDNAIGGTGADADTEPGEGLPAISVDPATGDAVALIHFDPGADNTAGTDDDIMANFTQGPGLGAFTHEKYFGRNNDTDGDGVFDAGETRQRIILFTDLEQAKATVPAESVSLTNEPVSNAGRVTPTAAPATTGDDIHDFAGTYDHDGNPATAAIAGTFDCVDPTTCRVTRSGTGNNGEHVAGETMVTSISGYRFTGTGTTAAVLSMLDDTWLAFGVWLQETAVDGTNTYVFGAFADGGAAIGDTDEPAAVASVTGDATYTGKAAGVHSKATEVAFFHGDATLNAKFGNGTEIGTITGMIHNIMSGGRSVGHDIELLVTDPGANPTAPNIVDAGTFSGQTRMGPITGTDTAGEAVYQMTGDWSGTFYNHKADVTTTMDIDESTLAPASVAGTFGVGMADDADTMMVDETESFVGAFGAHCAGTNCNTQ